MAKEEPAAANPGIDKEKLQRTRVQLEQQRDQYQAAFNQTTGKINLIDFWLKEIEDKEKTKQS